jgi:hypothetical protein
MQKHATGTKILFIPVACTGTTILEHTTRKKTSRSIREFISNNNKEKYYCIDYARKIA